MNSDHAPTAELPLPEQWCIVTIAGVIQNMPATYERGWWYWADHHADPTPAEIVTNWLPVNHAANLESELAIARDLIATMRARIEELEKQNDPHQTSR